MSEKSQKIRLACDLSPRQRTLLAMIGRGMNLKDAAYTMKISPKTAEYHLSKLREKSGLWTMPELTKLALRIGLAEIDV